MSMLAVGNTQPPLQWVLGVPSLGIKYQVHEDDHSPLPSAKVKNGGARTLLLHTSSLPAAYLIKHRDNFMFSFIKTVTVVLFLSTSISY
jgi:hypothetical protein